MYAGLIYNDIFSKSMNLFGGSMWQLNFNTSTIMENDHLTLDPKEHWLNGTYPFGMDPIWQIGGKNKVIVQNSFKMKISIIFGVLHMTFGLMLKFYNYHHFNDKWSMVTVFLPQMIFLVVLFGYLAALIFIKWIKFSAINPIPYNSECAPSILITFINMVLLKSTPSSNSSNADPIQCGPYMFHWQYEIQLILMVAALICVPWMVFSKPLHALLNRMRIPRINHVSKRILNGDTEAGSNDTSYEIETTSTNFQEDIGEILFHSGIQTIEFVLGSVSHTASYLRLWALSLAHARLSEMLWNLVLCQVWSISSPYAGILLPIFFAVWSLLTISILVLMEGLSAFLHTLRLHWVEFQSKFYNGQGYAFQPFSFNTISEDSNELLEAEYEHVEPTEEIA